MATLPEMLEMRKLWWNYFEKLEQVDLLNGYKNFLVSDDIESITIKLKDDRKIEAGDNYQFTRMCPRNAIELNFERWGITKEIFASIASDFDKRIKKIAEEAGIIDYTPPGEREKLFATNPEK